MPLASQTTAEHVMAAVEAIVVNGGPAGVDVIASFLDTTPANAIAALEMAIELGIVAQNGTVYAAISPLCRFIAIPDQKAAFLRILIESYRPFTVFRERLLATADLTKAAQASRLFCGLPAHRDAIKDTLISLGTYSRALVPEGGGNYQLETESMLNALQTIASATKDMVSAEGRIRAQLGPGAETALQTQRDTVIIPLADALIRANNRDGAGAVQSAGNAVESHITSMALRMGVALTSATGIISKLDKFSAQPRHLPKKLIQIGSYLGAIRNAADHGIDPDINNSSWQIRDATGLEYVFVACSFIAATIAIEKGTTPEI
jgi:hypothetical protein